MIRSLYVQSRANGFQAALSLPNNHKEETGETCLRWNEWRAGL